MVNKELILLYFKIGKKISTNIQKLAWGSKVLEQISAELQNELPRLKGFSSTNLQRMVTFSEFWMNYLLIGPTVSVQMENDEKPNSSKMPNHLKKNENKIYPTLSGKFAQAFFSVSFSHHYLIASKTETIEEAQFIFIKRRKDFGPIEPYSTI